MLTGTQKDGIKIKSEISFFIDQELQLKLDEEKTLITKLHSGFEFLGFMIRAWSYKQLKVSNVTQFRSINEDKIYTQVKRRTTSGKINIFPGIERIRKNLLSKGFLIQQKILEKP